MIKLLVNYTLIIISLMSISSVGYAHSYATSSDVDNRAGVKVTPITRPQNKLLPQALYIKTMSHTFKRKFAYQNQIVGRVYYRGSYSSPQLYGKVSSNKNYGRTARSYWP